MDTRDLCDPARLYKVFQMIEHKVDLLREPKMVPHRIWDHIEESQDRNKYQDYDNYLSQPQTWRAWMEAPWRVRP